MRTKYIAVAVAVVMAGSVAGTAWAFAANATSAADAQTIAPAAASAATVETDNCCLTGDCCCPGQGSCCDPAVRASAAASGVRYVKKAGAGCCATGNCCCPGQGSCCAPAAVKAEGTGTSCCSAKAERKDACCTK